MKEELYVDDVIVPLIAISKSNESKFRFLGTGFYVDKKGHLVTCLHIVNSCIEERLFAYQIGKKKELELTIIKKSDKYDLALCKSAPSGIETTWPFINKPYVDIGSDVEAYGYVHEPFGPNELPFRQRYMKGYISGIPRDPNYSDSFELSFPILFGMSGSPLICHLPIEGNNKRQTGIIGCNYGSRESAIVQHTVETTVNYEERVSKIVELGLSYLPNAIFSIFKNSDIEINLYAEENHACMGTGLVS